ncbi:putative 3-methyladenine DNA glycosylase [Geomonas limicola]|uniref:Putative 3-methyladenine DNA glycosylase n=1 Tax=Geomonas limicola TaxID=2740186 RepID=A0A6V8NBN3_9BACT|nr:putative 3-methyladenine DNA glycosylase [Geomonas limicola]
MIQVDGPGLSQRLQRSFFQRETQLVARELLGKLLERRVGGEVRVGRIVEVEAYLGPQDLAAHSSKGLTKRTRVLFGPPGYAYVYLVYGIYWCLNMVTEEEGHGTAVLLRALEPVQGIEMRTQGPGLLCKALGIDGSLNGQDLVSDELHLVDAPLPDPEQIQAKPRIGVAYAKEWAALPLRFYLKGNPYVSRS